MTGRVWHVHPYPQHSLLVVEELLDGTDERRTVVAISTTEGLTAASADGSVTVQMIERPHVYADVALIVAAPLLRQAAQRAVQVLLRAGIPHTDPDVIAICAGIAASYPTKGLTE